MTIHFTIFNSVDGNAGLTAILSNGSVHTLQNDHSAFHAVRDALLNQDTTPITDEQILALMKPAIGVGLRLQQLSERVTFDGQNIFFDGDALDSAVARHIIRILNEDEDSDVSYRALIAFMEKLYTNPSVASQESLYDFLRRHNITIASDGDFIAYKGVREDGTSIHSGFGIVDGKSMNGNLPNKPGSIVEIPRSQVDADAAIGCSTGLHAGAYSYASNFAQGKLLTVKINPRDVVSVPADASYQKLRVSRYAVLEVVDHENQASTWASGDNDFEDEDEDFDRDEEDCNDCENFDCDGTECQDPEGDADTDAQVDDADETDFTKGDAHIASLVERVKNGERVDVEFFYVGKGQYVEKHVKATLVWVTEAKAGDPMFTAETEDGFRHYYASRILRFV